MKRGSASKSKGSPGLIKVGIQAKSIDAKSRGVHSSMAIKPRTLRLGDITAKEEKKQKRLIKTRQSPDAWKQQHKLDDEYQLAEPPSQQSQNRIMKLSEQTDIFMRKQKSNDRKNVLKQKGKGNNLFEKKKNSSSKKQAD